MKTSVSEANTCPTCGKPLPAGALAGLCPACLMAQGVQTLADPAQVAEELRSLQAALA